MATVVHIIDGDTIDVNLNGEIVRVRYIGIDAPELNEPCGPEASAANAFLVAQQTVRLVKDVSEQDSFGRLLRYVYVGSRFVNAELVKQGLAEPVRYPPDTAQSVLLESITAVSPNCQQTATPTPNTAPIPTAAPTAAAQNCAPSYPTVCIPPAPPDLDCGDIPHRRFQVLQPDPRRFDRDKDGIGCESG